MKSALELGRIQNVLGLIKQNCEKILEIFVKTPHLIKPQLNLRVAVKNFESVELGSNRDCVEVLANYVAGYVRHACNLTNASSKTPKVAYNVPPAFGFARNDVPNRSTESRAELLREATIEKTPARNELESPRFASCNFLVSGVKGVFD